MGVAFEDIKCYRQPISLLYLGTLVGKVEAMFSLKKKITVYVPPFSNGPFANKKLSDIIP